MPVRVQLSRKKGWRMPPNTVSVARPGKWGNPYRVGEILQVGGSELTAADAVDLFRVHIEQEINPCVTVPDDVLDLSVLRGKNLACWCPLDQPCHADVLLELANGDTTP